MKTQIKQLQDERYYYPDVQVTCHPQDREQYFKQHPKLVVEVLSPSTERTDREEKFHAYRQLNSLEEYVLISQDSRRVEIYRRVDNWGLEMVQDDGELSLQSVGLVVGLDMIYEDVVL